MDVVVCGTAPFGADVLRSLAAAAEGRHRIVEVVSQPDRPAGRGRTVRPTPMAAAARELDLPVHQPASINAEDEVARLRATGAAVLVVAAYGQILRAPVLDAMLPLNVHGSLLPRWRGAAPVERAIMAGDRETGVCVMRMEQGLDTGPVAARHVWVIGPDDDAGAVFAALADEGGRMVAAALDTLDAGRELDFADQPADGVTYAAKITAADRVLDLTRTAREVHDRVRALAPHIGARAELSGRDVTVWRTLAPSAATAATLQESGLPALRCGDGPLAVAEVGPPGRQRMDAAAWLRGLRP